MRWETAALGAGIVGGALGFGLGWAAHKPPAPVSVQVPPLVVRRAEEAEKPFPDYPKPALVVPTPLPDFATTAPPTSTIGGDLPSLPLPGAGGSGPIGGDTPLTPDLPHGTPPVDDLNADEALAKRIVLQTGGEVVSVADARDDAGAIGRSIVAETAPASREALRNALRKALGARAVISDAGTGSSDDDPGLKKMQDDLAAARKKRDKDRIDFLPQSPILKDSEAEVLRLERALAERRKASSRVRLNVLVRPTL